MNDVINSAELESQIKLLKEQHKILEEEILENSKVTMNQLEIQRLKKRKLLLKDQITNLNKALNPDIIA